MRKPRPYWNFWKVIFAGWLIRYPGRFFEVFRFPLYTALGLCIIVIYNAVSK
jgi:hypothetical protein